MINSILGVIVLVLLVRLATKASVGVVLGAGVLLFILLACSSFLFMGASYQRHTIPPSPNVLVTEAASENPPEVLASSNEELWDRLTKSRIELGEEKSVGEDEEQDQDHTESTRAKPAWVDHPPKRIGNVTRRVVASDPYSTAEECHAQLETLLQGAVRERVQTLLANEARLSMLAIDLDSFGVDSFDIGLKYIVREICQDEFTETTSASFGEMKRVHVLLEFNPAVDGYLLAEWQKTERRHRLGVVGQFAAAVVGLLACVYGYMIVSSKALVVRKNANH